MPGKSPTLRNLEGRSFKHFKREIKWTPLKVLLTVVSLETPEVKILILVSLQFLSSFWDCQLVYRKPHFLF